MTRSAAPWLLAALGCLALASLLPAGWPHWFAAPGERVNFLGHGALVLLAGAALCIRSRWTLGLALALAALGAATALTYGILTGAHLGAWASLATLCAAAVVLLWWPAAVRARYVREAATSRR